MDKEIVEGLENEPKPNATAHDTPEAVALEPKTDEPKSKEGKRPKDADNSDPLEIAKKDITDSVEIDDTEEAKLVQEQEIPKVELSEDIASLLEGIELEKEFKEKAITIFEAAVSGQVADLHKTMLEANELAMKTYKETLETKLTEKVDLYLNESVSQWLEKNQVAVKSSLRAQIAESFMANVISIMETHYIDLPEGKEDILEASLEEVTKLKEQVESLLQDNKEIKTVLESKEKEVVFESAIKDLTDTQKERVKTLSESIKADVDLETFKSKLGTIIEGLTSQEKTEPSKFVTEDANGNVQENTQDAPIVDKYAHIKDLASKLL